MRDQTDLGLRVAVICKQQPLQSHEGPVRPWAKVGCDSFYIKQKLSEFQRFADEFFKCKFVKFLLIVSTIRLNIKVAELNTPSDGKGITGIPSAVFMRWEINRRKNANLHKLSQLQSSAWSGEREREGCLGNNAMQNKCHS